VAQPMVDKNSSSCTRDTFYFDDYSILNHTNASWKWEFDPQPAWVESDTIRNPRVVFGNIGTYKVSLTVSNDAGSNSKTIEDMVMLEENACEPETVPGLAMDFNGVDASVQFAAFNEATNHFTFTAWIKRRAPQNDWGGILFARGGNTIAGLSLRANGDLGYHWNDRGYNWSSGLNVPEDEWAYVAMRVTPDSITLFLNNQYATHVTTVDPEEFNTDWYLGVDPNGGSRYFNGEIEEVAVWNKAITTDTIRLMRHLIKEPGTAFAPDHYYQFNATSNMVLDRTGFAHGLVGSTVTRNTSSAPIGIGNSELVNVSGNGTYSLEEPNVLVEVGDLDKNGVLVGTYLKGQPNTIPPGDIRGDGFWILNWYGTEPIAQIDSISFLGVDTIRNGEIGVDGLFSLDHRFENADTDTWGDLGVYLGAFYGNPGDLNFGPLPAPFTTGQYIIRKNFTVGTAEKDGFEVGYDATRGTALLVLSVSKVNKWERFEVERKSGERSFEKISDFSAIANQTNYRIFDRNPENGINTYRVKMIDEVGRQFYTEERRIYVHYSPFVFRIFPNPVKKGAPLVIKSDLNEAYTFYLLSTDGKMLKNVNLSGTEAKVLIDQAPGVYLYRIQTDEKMYNGKLIIK
ncbi:MAG: T9SS type A sorting domain-containing protein, partial [Saprospiraceae bacterium]|nr:T9SS type A sorting domain-containing protein [Saprospiraceae bacterium]